MRLGTRRYMLRAASLALSLWGGCESDGDGTITDHPLSVEAEAAPQLPAADAAAKDAPTAPTEPTATAPTATAPIAPDATAPAATAPSAPCVRTYYIAAEEIAWDYAPQHTNVMMGRPFTPEEEVFVKGNGKDRIGSTYTKALYFEYTDATFTVRKQRPADEAYLGMLGPIVRAAVGDTIEVVFANKGSRPYSVHPHGVHYSKASEGAESNDGSAEHDKHDDMVMPGETYTYHWDVPERAGPGPRDPSSTVWLYHSHIDDGIGDEYAGLVGAIVVTRKDQATAAAKPADVDQEVFSLFMVDNENASDFAEDNLATRAPEADADDPEFEESNLMHSVNGFVYANGAPLTVRVGTLVRWYLLSLGTEVDLHTPHWHGNTVLEGGHRTDVIELLPASMKTVDMVPDEPGTWMFHCHVNDHIEAGMGSLYTVAPATL